MDINKLGLQSLGVKISGYAFLITLVLSLSTSAIVVQRQIAAGEQDIQDTIILIANQVVPNLTLNTWEVNVDRINGDIKRLMEMEFVDWVHLHDEANSYGDGEKSAALLLEVFPLTLNGQTFGHLEIGLNREIIHREAWEEGLKNLFLQVGSLLFFTIALLLLHYHMVSRPLKSLARYMKDMDYNAFSSPIERPFPADDEGNEINRIWIAMEEMRSNLFRETQENALYQLEISQMRQDNEEILNGIGEALFIQDLETSEILNVNRRACLLYGYEREELMKRSIEDLSLNIPPYSSREIREHLDKALRGERSFLWRAKKKDGTLFWAEVLIIKGEINGRACALTTIRDVTERKKKEDDLAHLQRMDSVGQLAGGIAHDFNNMLAGIMGAADLLAQSLPEGREDHREYVKLIIDSGERAAELISKLLLFSRKDQGELAPADCHGIINSSLALIRRSIDKRIVIETDFRAETTSLMAHEASLQNGIINLIINAKDAMPEGGVVEISTKNVILEEPDCLESSFELSPGPYIQISIRDEGEGIPKEIIDKIFEPFFTTKDVGKGTGMGLAAVYGAVQKHLGSVTVYSEQGKGTLFHILLPVDESLSGMETTSSGSEIPRGRGRILVIDDEPVIRKSLRSMLTQLGYSVCEAKNGREGLEALEKSKDRTDLIILDMIMPEKNGIDVLRSLRERGDDVKVLISSGFTRKDDRRELKAMGVTDFLLKPYRFRELAVTLARILEAD